MKTRILPIAATNALLFFPNLNFAQAPDLDTAANFLVFSITGATGKTGSWHITGNVGTNTGTINSISYIDGVMYGPDLATMQYQRGLTLFSRVAEKRASWVSIQYPQLLRPTIFAH